MTMSKIAISLPDRVLEAIERERRSSGETRSAFMRRAVEALLRLQRERKLEGRYTLGYLESPETPDEADWVLRAGLASLGQEPWDEGTDR